MIQLPKDPDEEWVYKKPSFTLLNFIELAKLVAESKGVFVSERDAIEHPERIYFCSLKNRFGEDISIYVRKF